MEYFMRMLERTNLQNIGSWIQIGSEVEQTDSADMEERAEKALKVLKRDFEQIVPKKSYRRGIEIAREYSNACCDIYFNMGMKVGAKIMLQLLDEGLKEN